MKLLLSYLRQRRGQIALFCLCEGLYTVILLLYRVPLSVAVYPGALCAGLALLALATDYSRQRRRCREVRSVGSWEGLTSDQLPEPGSLAEEEYRALLPRLSRENQELLVLRDRKYRDMQDYFTVWAHQIKTPISSMALRLQREDSELSRQLAGELNRIEQYVQMAMTYLRLDADTTDYRFREYALDDIVHQSLRRFAGEFISRKLRLRYEPLNIRVISDEKWLCFVVEQVLSNALKYTPEGEIHIWLEKPATLCVGDTGIGIAPEDLPRIFEKGFTGFNGREDHRATGLGLYLCRRILENLGHSIRAESVPGQGTVIRMDLSQRHPGEE